MAAPHRTWYQAAMINFERIAPHAHRITVMAEFRQADAEALVEFVEAEHASGGGGNLLIDLTAMAGFSWSAVAEELGHIGLFLKYLYSLDRIAILSDEDWIRSVARLESALLPGVEYQVYDDDEADAALAWVTDQSEAPHRGAFQPIDIGHPNIAGFELSGRLDREESERAVAMARAALEDPDCSRLMIVIRHWHGFDPDAAISREVMAGKLELMKHLERYAIVGGPDWIRALASTFGALVQPEVRSFDLEDQDKAVAWLSE